MLTAHPHRCFYCGKRIRKDATRDHVQPLSRKGTSSKRNLVWACFKCNNDKGNLTLEEYRLIVAFRRGWVRKANLVFHGEKEEN